MSSNTVSVVVSKTGVFQDWLKEHPDAAVVVEDGDLSDYEAEDEEDVRLVVLDDQGDGATDTEPSTRAESRASDFSSANREEEEKLTKARLERLVPLTRWNPAVPKVGPFNVKRMSTALKLEELKSTLYLMEDSTNLDDLGRFKRFREEGYILVRGALNATNGGAKLLEALQKDIARLVKKNYGIPLGPVSLEEVREDESFGKKRKMEIDKTVQVYPEVSDVEEQDSEDDWTSMEDLGKAVLSSEPLESLLRSFVNGANEFHGRPLRAEKRFSWVRLRGRLNPRKEWCEYYYMRDNATEMAAGKFDKRYARELTRRLDNPKPRYGFSIWVAAGPNPIDGGNMALLPGSHMYTGFLKPPRGEETPYDFKKQAKEMPWVLEDLQPGDALIVDMQTVRAFVSNKRHPHFIGAYADNMYMMGE